MGEEDLRGIVWYRGGDMLSEDICIVFEPVEDTIFAL